MKSSTKPRRSCCRTNAPKISGSSLNLSAGNTNPDGKINLIAAIDSREVSRTVTSRNTFWQSNESLGSLNQTLHMTNINVPIGSTNFQAAGGISVQLPKGAKLPQQIATLAKQPGNEYLGTLAARSDIDWKQVEVVNKTWDYKKAGITQETAIVVAIVVTIVTAGAASGAGMSLATSAGFATTTTAAGATVMATAGGAALAGATAAAITTLATQAAIAILNNKGDIAGALKELGSKENVRGLATAVITAGLVQGLGVAFNLPTGAGTDTTILQKLQTNLINGVAGSLVSTAINGGSLEDAIKNAVKTAIISSVAAQGAGIIGDMKVGDNPALNQFTGSLAHAILGCAVGSATAGSSSGCAAGAGGAVVGELSAEWYGKTFGGNPADAANFAKLTTAIAGLAGGANAMTIAGITSNNAVANNFLGDHSKAELESLRKKALTAGGLTKAEATRLVILDAADQMSDGLLTKYRNSEKLTDNEMKNLNIYLGAYSEQNGKAATVKLVNEGVQAISGYPFGGTIEMQTAFTEKMSWTDLLLGRTKSPNDQINNDARIQAGLFLNTAPNEALSPTAQAQNQRNATLDALINSPLLASATYLGGTAIGASPDKIDAATQTASLLSDVGSSFVLPKVGLTPALGETTAISIKPPATSDRLANSNTVLGLKEELRTENLANIAKQDMRLAEAVKGGGGSLNFPIGSGNATEANSLGSIWVGDGARPLSGVPGGLISADGTLVYRPPTAKPGTPAAYNPTGIQANFQMRNPITGAVTSNGHMVIK